MTTPPRPAPQKGASMDMSKHDSEQIAIFSIFILSFYKHSIQGCKYKKKIKQKGMN